MYHFTHFHSVGAVGADAAILHDVEAQHQDPNDQPLPPPPSEKPKLLKSSTEPLPSQEPLGLLTLPRSTSYPPSNDLHKKLNDKPVSSRRQSFRTALAPILSRLPSLTSLPLPLSLVRAVSSGSGQFYCQICMCNEERSLGYQVNTCQHEFCKDCLSQYLTVKINDAQIANFVCPFIDDKVMGAKDGWSCQACTFFNTPAAIPGATVRCEVCETSQDAPPAEEPGCKTIISKGDLARIVSPETLEKHARFKEMRENVNYRECPRCQFPNTVGPSRFSNALVCGDCSATVQSYAEERSIASLDDGKEIGCGHEYCFVHSDQVCCNLSNVGEWCDETVRMFLRLLIGCSLVALW